VRICQTAAAVAVIAAAVIIDVARTGWIAATAGYITIAAIAVILLDAAIATDMALHAPGQRPAAAGRSAAPAFLAASAGLIVLALNPVLPPLGSPGPGQQPGLVAVLRPSASPIPASPIPASPTAVEFIISGYVPADLFGGKPVIDYGSSLSTGEAEPAQINGTITYEVPFSWAAHSYFVNVALVMTGHVTCKVVLVGPYPDRPVTLDSAAAAGEFAICSALAEPAALLSGWLSWQDQARHPSPASSGNDEAAGPRRTGPGDR
jgi:hypothetical protein